MIRRHMPRLQMCLPIQIRPPIPPLLNRLHLLRRPNIQIDRFNCPNRRCKQRIIMSVRSKTKYQRGKKGERRVPLEMCVPIERWMPEQRMQRKQPRFQEAHRGSFFLQSTHTLLSGDLTSARRILAFASVCARDCVTRDMLRVYLPVSSL